MKSSGEKAEEEGRRLESLKKVREKAWLEEVVQSDR